MKPERCGPENGPEIHPGPPDEAAFNRAFNERVAKLRVDAGLTQAQVAAALGIHAHAYQHFEYRSPMPAYLIPTFAAVVGADVCFVLTGDHRGASGRACGNHADRAHPGAAAD